MAGTIIADKIQTENAFLTLNVGQTLVATINSSGILNSSGGTMVGANGSVSNTAITGLVTASQIANVANTQITGNITAAQITSVANTQLTGLIQAAQIGSANATLVTSGTLPTARLPAGTVLQVVSFGTITAVSTSTNTETDTGVFATITPISVTSKILVLVTLMGVAKTSTNSASRVHLNLYRGTNSGTLINNSGANFYTQTALDQRGAIALSVLDSPSTTSAQIYKLYFYNDENAAQVSVNRDGNSGTSTMTLMEIAA